MRRRAFLGATGLGLAGALAGCLGGNSGKGGLRIAFEPDASITDFEALSYRVKYVGLNVANGASGELSVGRTVSLAAGAPGRPVVVYRTRFKPGKYLSVSVKGDVRTVTASDGSHPDVAAGTFSFDHTYHLNSGETTVVSIPVRVKTGGSMRLVAGSPSFSTVDGLPPTSN